jgi:GntR family transcriptional regulator
MGKPGRFRNRLPKSDEVRSAFALATAEAQRLGSPYLATEHVLMGIARLPDSRGAAMLERLGVDRDIIVREAERLSHASPPATNPLPFGRPQSDPTRLPTTAGVMRAIRAVEAEVEAVGAPEIGSDFVIVGLLVEGRGIAATVLTRAGVTLERARADLDTRHGERLSRELSASPPSRARVLRGTLPRQSLSDATTSSFRETDELRKVFGLLNDEARRFRSPVKRPEHFVLAIAHTPDCAAAVLLERLGVDLGSLARDVERAVAALPDSAQPGIEPRRDSGPRRTDGGFSEALLRAVWAARSEWQVSRRELMDSTHMLLGVLVEGSGVVVTALGRFGVTLERVRAELPVDNPVSLPVFEMTIDERSDLSIYEQIIARVQEAIATGALKPGDRLPTVRHLADTLDIAPGTVARAYAELESRGVVVTEGARGTRVAEQNRSSLSSDARRATLIELLRPVAVEAFHLGASTAELHDALDVAAGDIFPERGAA